MRTFLSWFLFILLVLAGLAFVSWQTVGQVYAHDWFGKTNDPVFNSNCCGGHDCAPVDPAWVTETKDGFRLVMSLEQARTVNPSTNAAVDAIIPWDRVQSPPNAEHAFYACIYQTDRSMPRAGVICFFATPTM